MKTQNSKPYALRRDREKEVEGKWRTLFLAPEHNNDGFVVEELRVEQFHRLLLFAQTDRRREHNAARGQCRLWRIRVVLHLGHADYYANMGGKRGG